MLQPTEIAEPMGTQEANAASVEMREALNIGEVLRRAREIHRRHGGIFGYDFEDWARAWSEVPDQNERTGRVSPESTSTAVLPAMTRAV